MGLVFRKTKRVSNGTALNASKSGVSASKRVGPVSVSTRGRGSVKLGKGLGFRFKL